MFYTNQSIVHSLYFDLNIHELYLFNAINIRSCPITSKLNLLKWQVLVHNSSLLSDCHQSMYAYSQYSIDLQFVDSIISVIYTQSTRFWYHHIRRWEIFLTDHWTRGTKMTIQAFVQFLLSKHTCRMDHACSPEFVDILTVSWHSEYCYCNFLSCFEYALN